jgi:hypothetical protein
VPPIDWFDQVNYKGAFEPNTAPWVKGWTLLDQMGFLADVVLSVNEIAELQSSIYPNPAEDVLNIELTENTNQLLVEIYDITGKKIKNMDFSGVKQRISINVSDLNSGMYIVSLSANQAQRSFKVFIR